MSKKRYLAAFGAAGLIFAGVYGAAATLDINDAGLAQAGGSDDLSCDDEGVTIDGYFLETNQYPTSRSFGVVVSDIAEDCVGHTMVARTFDAAGEQLGYGVAEPIEDSTERIRYSQAPDDGVDVESIESVRLTIG